MRRREFITLMGGISAGWPLAAWPQQPAMPVVGYLSSAASADFVHFVAAFRRGLAEMDYIEGRNVAVEYRWAEGEYNRLPELATDLVDRGVAAIVASGGIQPALAAKAATGTIPIVFTMASDPVAVGLVVSLNRPGGNLTGVTNLNVEVGPKRLELLHEFIPTATIVALLVNPTNSNAETLSRQLQAAASMLGLQSHVLHASAEHDFDAVFATLRQLRAEALVIGPDPFFTSRREQLAALTVRHAVPTIYQYREFAVAGGLMSFGGSNSDSYRQVGIYTGRILKGEKPADLPVIQSAKVELIINLKTAKAIGLDIAPAMLARADEVIE